MPARKSCRGFTLIELMVVLLIMGLFAGLVTTITRPDERALLRLEADRPDIKGAVHRPLSPNAVIARPSRSS